MMMTMQQSKRESDDNAYDEGDDGEGKRKSSEKDSGPWYAKNHSLRH